MSSRRRLLRAALSSVPLLLSPSVFTCRSLRLRSTPGDRANWFWIPGHAFTMKAVGSDTGKVCTWMLAENKPARGCGSPQALARGRVLLHSRRPIRNYNRESNIDRKVRIFLFRATEYTSSLDKYGINNRKASVCMVTIGNRRIFPGCWDAHKRARGAPQL